MKTFKQFIIESPQAYHGSPFNFDKFTLKKIGTGEGHMAYGWGLYFTSDEDIAKYYRDILFNMRAVDAINKQMDKVYAKIKPLETNTYGKYKTEEGYKLKNEYNRLMDLRSKISNTKLIYHVNINVHEDEFLDWDEQYKYQSEYVKNALEGMPKEYEWIVDDFKQDYYGENFYKDISFEIGGSGDVAYEKTSKLLLSLGIKGIKYVGSGASTKFNYVLFDESLVEITKKEFKENN